MIIFGALSLRKVVVVHEGWHGDVVSNFQHVWHRRSLARTPWVAAAGREAAAGEAAVAGFVVVVERCAILSTPAALAL